MHINRNYRGKNNNRVKKNDVNTSASPQINHSEERLSQLQTQKNQLEDEELTYQKAMQKINEQDEEIEMEVKKTRAEIENLREEWEYDKEISILLEDVGINLDASRNSMQRDALEREALLLEKKKCWREQEEQINEAIAAIQKEER